MKYPFIVAEAGINGNGDFKSNVELIKQAKLAGADAIKFQLFTERARPRAKQFILPKTQWQELQKVAHCEGIPMFWSVFDFESVDLAAELGAPYIKLSLIERRNSRLINKCNLAFEGKPRFVSVDLWGQYHKIELAGWDKLYCPNNGWSGYYPTHEEHIDFGEYFYQLDQGEKLGWSDHCPGILTAVIMAQRGATIIEKHFKLNEDCMDAKCSANPRQFQLMVDLIRGSFN
ncbi:MAG: N-acetylneuraminate synthase family protein [Patescibacteria group bacterium]|nr:N-acetylneuraminate synthase family protein [Patescibacteria group bacterium]